MRIAKVTFALTIALSSMAGIKVANAEENETNKRIEQQLSTIQTQISKMDKEINLSQNEITILNRQITKLKQAIWDNEGKVKNTESQLFVLENDIQNRQREIEKVKKEMGVSKDGMSLFPNDNILITEPQAKPNNKEYLRLASTEMLANLFSKEAELQVKLKEVESLKVELTGMSDLLKEQIKEKVNLVKELEQKEQKNKAEKEKLLQDSKMLKKQKSAIDQAFVYEKARLDGTLNLKPEPLNPEFGENITSTDVPKEFMKYYLFAEQQYGVPWYYLAALHSVETSFSTHPTMISSVGAIGPFQFMPATWVGYKYETSGGLVPADLDITNIDVIKQGNGYGVDANKDGVASPWSIADSVATAAKYLVANDFSTDKRRAIWHYNHADWYVNKVISRAEQFKNHLNNQRLNPIVLAPGDENRVTTVGNRWINNSVYLFGGGRNQNDINQGNFDCSSFVHWAYSQVGINLGELTSVSTETLKNFGKLVNDSQMQPGDLVFFDTYKKDGHVGIYIGDNKFIGAQSSTGVAIADMSKGYWKEKFNHRIKRIR
ncbi:NlpC/P60 family protein [Bacillus massilinigeriensis]|uniref:NlpC/P60 family protein n=1 Tax=Bacillus mediterraneensis TaxID=1805474 RepID=UPI0008F8470B|nr:NlpC/P60 family protein [Bacillus mediterraneensis]